MSLISDLVQRVHAIVFRRRIERELDEELRFHLDCEEAARARAGSHTPRRDALVAFGGVERMKDDVREARGTLSLEESVADVRYALRALRRHIGFSASVIGVLGLAIGASATVFTVANRIVLAELPYRDADRLVTIVQQSPANRWSLSAVDLQAIASQQRTFEDVGAARYATASLSGAGTPERIRIAPATSGFFRALGVSAGAGRLLTSNDDDPAAAPTVVLSDQLASRSFGGASMAIGKSVMLDGVSHSVVGVLETGREELAGFPADAWPILRLGTPERRGPFGFRAVARLRPGVTLGQATRDMAGISERLFPLWASSFQDSVARLTPIPLREAIVGGATHQLGLFAAAVGLVLLLAVANVATLALVRASGREHELAVRAALGAGRHRLARLVVTECLTLGLLAGAAGVLLAAVALTLVDRVAPGLPRLGEVRLDGAAIAFAAGAALLSGALIGLASISVGRAGSGTTLITGSARTGTGRRAHAMRGALVITEFALALPLLLGAGLLLNSFLRLQDLPLGFDAKGVTGVALSLPAARYTDPAQVQEFWRRLESRTASIDGVTALGLAGVIPPDTYGDVNNFDLVDKPVAAGSSQPVAPWPSVTSGYFAALGLTLLDGRLFTLADTADAPPVVVVSRSWASQYYPNESAVGKRLRSGGCTTCPPTTVVGVVSDAHYRGLTGTADAVYAPLAQEGIRSLYVVARTRLAPEVASRALHATIAALDPGLAPVDFVMTDRLRSALGDPRRWTAVVGSFAAAGALLAALGIFGLMSFLVRQHQREHGVRLALGASPRSLTLMVVRRGMRYAAVGTAIGLGVAFFMSRWIASLLYGVGAMDLASVAGAVVVLLAIATIACWIPGARAARIRPTDALGSG